MSSIVELRDMAMRRAQAIKEKTVADATGEPWPDPPAKIGDPGQTPPTELHNTLEGYRGDQPVVLVQPMHQDRDIMAMCCRFLAVGMGCDAIAMTMESWHPNIEHAEINPATGKEWGETYPNEMQTTVDHFGGLEKGWLTAMLTTIVVNRAGDIAMGGMDYTVHSKTSVLGIPSYSITWGADEDRILTDSISKPDMPTGGFLVESMLDSMNAPTIFQEYMAEHGDPGISENAMYATADIASIFTMKKRGFEGAVGLLAETKERAEAIEAALGRMSEDGWFQL